MKIYTILCAFSHNDIVGASVLTVDGQLPSTLMNDGGENSLDCARTLCNLYTGIDKKWPLEYRQVGIIEDEDKEKIFYIIYSLYFQEINTTKNDAFWKKFNDLEGLNKIYQNIIRYTAIQRY